MITKIAASCVRSQLGAFHHLSCFLCYRCLNHCTYCKTKHARGDLGSYPPAEIVSRAAQAFQGEASLHDTPSHSHIPHPLLLHFHPLTYLILSPHTSIPSHPHMPHPHILTYLILSPYTSTPSHPHMPHPHTLIPSHFHRGCGGDLGDQ